MILRLTSPVLCLAYNMKIRTLLLMVAEKTSKLQGNPFCNCHRGTIPYILCENKISNQCLFSQAKRTKNAKMEILTHLAYIANGKKRVILCNNFTGRISVTLLCGICDVSYPTKQRTTNVISVCKYQHYSQIFGGISAMQWRKAERYRRYSVYCVLESK